MFFRFIFKLILRFLATTCFIVAGICQTIEEILTMYFPNMNDDFKESLTVILFLVFDISLILVLLDMMQDLELMLYYLEEYIEFNKFPDYIKMGNL